MKAHHTAKATWKMIRAFRAALASRENASIRAVAIEIGLSPMLTDQTIYRIARGELWAEKPTEKVDVTHRRNVPVRSRRKA